MQLGIAGWENVTKHGEAGRVGGGQQLCATTAWEQVCAV